MPPAPDIDALIASVETDAASDDPLDRLAAAAAMAGDLTGLADQLVGHYVDEARKSGASWADIGGEIGVTKQAAHQGHRARGARPPRRDDLFSGRLRLATDRFKLAIDRAREVAAERRHGFVGTEHLLLGVLREATSVGAAVLTELGVTEDAVAAKVDAAKLPATGTSDPSATRPFTARAKRALHDAHRTARRERCRFLGTEHIVMALADGESLATDILRDLGVTPERVHAEVHRAWQRQ
jgi:uncharacterized protein YjiS (DUF1127 family)